MGTDARCTDESILLIEVENDLEFSVHFQRPGEWVANADGMTNNATRFAASLTSTAEQRTRRYRNEGKVKLDLSQLIDALGYGPVE